MEDRSDAGRGGDAVGPPEGPVLVVGGAGYIGSHTVRCLTERGIEVVVVDNLSTGHRAAVDVPFEEIDLGDGPAVEDVLERHRIRSVMHFAAKAQVGESVAHPAMYYRENVVHTHALLEAMRRRGVSEFVFSSTCAIFGVPETKTIGEELPKNPISPYGRTKLHIEHMLEDYGAAYGLRYAALRYFNAAGAAPDGSLGEHHDPESHLIPLVLQVALGQRDEILIFGDDYPTPDGTCVRDYIHVVDLADAHLRALARLQTGSTSICCNLGTKHGYSVKEVIETARRVTGHPIPARVVGRRAGDPPELVSGGTRAAELLGWKAERADLERIIEDAWRFHSARPQGFGGEA